MVGVAAFKTESRRKDRPELESLEFFSPPTCLFVDVLLVSDSLINAIENFWGLAKTRLCKFRGIHKSTFYFHLKECEFRFNHKNETIYKLLLKILRDRPLKVS